MADLVAQTPTVLGTGLRPGPSRPVPNYAASPVELAVPGPPGDASGAQAALDAHVAASRPHLNAESGYDAAGYFTAMTV